MRVSIVIPVWNGVDVLARCLDAVRTYSGECVPEVVCVDNGSHDGSAALIEEAFPWVHLIRQPVNLGFAGGVNVGTDAADGDLFVLLNQDCVVHAGWLEALQAALGASPGLGITGCTTLRPDGSVDHAGAVVRRPDAVGVHLTSTVGSGDPSAGAGWTPVDYVTGALMALRRTTWDVVGGFDEGFYPAYYEDADYCYRARRRGIEVGYVPEARVTHLFSSKAWQTDPIAHAVNQHRARYRFVGKHFDSDEIAAFAAAEASALEEEAYLDQAVARVIAARHAVRCLPDVMARRRVYLGEPPDAVHRQMQVALRDIRCLALTRSVRLLETGLEEPPIEAWQQRNRELRQELLKATPSPQVDPVRVGPKPGGWRTLGRTISRLLSVLRGREDAWQAVHAQQLELMARQLDLLRLLHDEHEKQAAWQWGYHLERLERRVDLFQTLVEHD